PAAGRKLDLDHPGSLGDRGPPRRFGLWRDCNRIKRRQNLGQSCWRQRNNWLIWIPAARATSEATAPGSMAAVTIRSFSDRDQLRRRSTDVITSTCVLVIGVVLGLLLGLATMTQLRKAVLTGGLRQLGNHAAE